MLPHCFSLSYPQHTTLRHSERLAMPPDLLDPLDGPIDDTLDLHGFRAREVRTHVAAFLASLRMRQPGALVHLITGRGRGSAGGPVLRSTVRTLLRKANADLVEAWGLDDAEGGFLVRLGGR